MARCRPSPVPPSPEGRHNTDLRSLWPSADAAAVLWGRKTRIIRNCQGGAAQWVQQVPGGPACPNQPTALARPHSSESVSPSGKGRPEPRPSTRHLEWFGQRSGGGDRGVHGLKWWVELPLEGGVHPGALARGLPCSTSLLIIRGKWEMSRGPRLPSLVSLWQPSESVDLVPAGQLGPHCPLSAEVSR